ncbi:MAG: PDZ domain-containing protein, partial [Planctomycetota bacterium]
DPHHGQPPRGRTGPPGFLGVYLDPDAPGPGAPVDGAQPGSPAARAGLREGDRIVAANGRSLTDTRALVKLLGGLRPGDRLRLEVEREGTRRTVVATLAARPAEPAPAPRGAERPGWLGVALEVRAGRLVVIEVDERGPVARAGIRPGDAILRVDGRAVASLDDLAEFLSGRPAGAQVQLTVERRGWEKTFSITLAERP